MENQVNAKTPPTFLVHATDDSSVSYKNSVVYAEKLNDKGIQHKYLQLNKGGHGFGLNFGKTGLDWTIDLEKWLRKDIRLFDIKSGSERQSTQSLKIVLKLDDLAVENNDVKCRETFMLLKKKQIKAGFGIIPARCDSSTKEILQPFLQAKNDKNEDLFEIWHHGLDHVRPEFEGTGYAYQRKHFQDADKWVAENLGIQMRSFGTPYNASDSITNRVISENSNYKVFMFSKVVPEDTKRLTYLGNRTNMENGTGNPEFDYFKENYYKNKEKFTNYMVLQGHPNMWTADKLEQVELILDFLISKNCEFVLPFELHQIGN